MKKRVIIIIIAALAVVGVVTGIIVGTSVKHGDSAGTSASESISGTSGAQTSENSGAGGNSEEGKESKITETEHTWEISSRTAENLTITTVYVCKTCGETKTETISGKEAVMAMLKTSASNTQKAENITVKTNLMDIGKIRDYGWILISVASDGRVVVYAKTDIYPQGYATISPIGDRKHMLRSGMFDASGKGEKEIGECDKFTFKSLDQQITIVPAYNMLSIVISEEESELIVNYTIKIENSLFTIQINLDDSGIIKYVFDENQVYRVEVTYGDEKEVLHYKLEFDEETYKKADEFLSSLEYDEEE